MSDTLMDLYREVILDHNRDPRNFGELEHANRVVEGVNPLCGDRMTLYVKTSAAGQIEDVGFTGTGCAISVASASLMTERIKGLTVDEALELFELLHDVLTGVQEPDPVELDKLAALAGVRQYPSRVKCASLAWHALKSALTTTDEKISTE
ncbi:MAG: SUF system NifU family Fe-S cluster assembly protein [Gammaproteobacteria bacterium]